MTFYEWFYKTFKPLVMRIYRVEVRGRENIPAEGALIAANHTSFSDVLVISAASTRQVRYMAKKELFRTPIGPLVRALGAYPVDRGGSDVGSIKRTFALIEAGDLVGIFPQGHRQGRKDPRTTEVKAGVGMIAYHTKAPVVPVFVENSRMKTGMFRKNIVTFGSPIRFEELAFTGGHMTEYTRAARIIFDRICEIKYGRSELPDAEKPALPETRKE
ncbi:MAG: lysophospholipid acyltransferase family protein [Eubacteriales bacterium]